MKTIFKSFIIAILITMILRLLGVFGDVHFVYIAILVIVLTCFVSVFKFKKSILKFDVDVTKIAVNIAKKLNTIGYNIQTAQGFTKNNKKIIFLNQYFGKNWDSGIKLAFEINNNKLLFNGYGKFGFRNKQYDTTENRNLLKGLITDVEKTKL